MVPRWCGYSLIGLTLSCFVLTVGAVAFAQSNPTLSAPITPTMTTSSRGPMAVRRKSETPISSAKHPSIAPSQQSADSSGYFGFMRINPKTGNEIDSNIEDPDALTMTPSFQFKESDGQDGSRTFVDAHTPIYLEKLDLATTLAAINTHFSPSSWYITAQLSPFTNSGDPHITLPGASISFDLDGFFGILTHFLKPQITLYTDNSAVPIIAEQPDNTKTVSSTDSSNHSLQMIGTKFINTTLHVPQITAAGTYHATVTYRIVTGPVND